MPGLAQAPPYGRAAAYCRRRRGLLRLPHVHPPSHRGAVVIGLEPRRMDAVRRELLVAVLRVAGDADRTDHFAVGVADQEATALGKDLLAAMLRLAWSSVMAGMWFLLASRPRACVPSPPERGEGALALRHAAHDIHPAPCPPHPPLRLIAS